MKITRRFRREMRQELRMGERVNPLHLALLAGAGLVLAEATRAEGQQYWLRAVGFPLVLVLNYFITQLAFAQIRAKAQPFDHTLEIDDDGIRITDNYRQRTRQHPWTEFERLSIDARHFTIRRRGASRGESYMIDRKKLTDEEERFLGERLVEL